MSGLDATTNAGFDPSLVLIELSPRDGVHLAGLLMADLRRNQATFLRAVAFKEYRSAVRAAHSLASIAAAVGGGAVSRVAGDIEQLVQAHEWERAEGLERTLCASLNSLVDQIERWQAVRLEEMKASEASGDDTRSGGGGRT